MQDHHAAIILHFNILTAEGTDIDLEGEMTHLRTF